MIAITISLLALAAWAALATVVAVATDGYGRVVLLDPRRPYRLRSAYALIASRTKVAPASPP
jgi:hypothetical protein